jgi:8-amino-7-oxononanoate synthase
MKTRRGVERLSEQEKAKLLASVQQTAAPRPRAAPAAAAKPGVSFKNLPGYEEFRVMRATSDLLGIVNPFYRLHDARAGATSAIAGKPVVNFASYDYLGFNGDPAIAKAVAAAVEQWGTSVSASRITAGERPFHRDLERRLAALHGSADAVVFVSGHATNISVISQVVGPKDLVLHDALIHNSALIGAQLSGAHRRIFPHNDMDALEAILAAERSRYGRALILTESLFSMDGDIPDLPRLIELKNRFGCWLMVDEAHALGVLGANGHGAAEHFGIDPASVDIWMGTLSKTLVSAGGYIAGAQELIDFLKFTAPGFVYSVGIPAPAAVAALSALDLLDRAQDRIARLQANGRQFRERAVAAGLDVGHSAGFAVVPVIIGDSLRTVVMAQRLLERGVNAVPIIPPGVQERAARLRFFVCAGHEREQIEQTVALVRGELSALERQGVSLANIVQLAAAAREGNASS